MRILLIEDDRTIANNLKLILQANHYIVEVIPLGKDAFYPAETENFDLIILDWMLPDMEGVDLCLELRQKDVTAPILFLTAKGEVGDKVRGLNSGGDDYLVKPFSKDELLARIKALLRRRENFTLPVLLQIGDLTINTSICQVKKGEEIIKLSPKEYALLEYLLINEGRVISRMEIIEHVWGESIDLLSNTVDVHIRYLRKKIADSPKKHLIQTVPEKGYLICLT